LHNTLHSGVVTPPVQVRKVMTQWENECISLSVLSLALVMTVEGENECTSLSIFSMALIMTAQWENECISRLSSLWPGS